MYSKVTTRTLTHTQLILVIAVLIGVIGIGAALIPTLPSQNQSQGQGVVQNTSCGLYGHESCSLCNTGLVASSSQTCVCPEQTVWDGNTCAQEKRSGESRALFRIPLLPKMTDGPVLLYGHSGDVKKKLNIVFFGANGYSFEEFSTLVKFIVGSGIQAYSPFREHWSKINIWVVLGMGDTHYEKGRTILIDHIRKETEHIVPDPIIISIQKTGNLRAYALHKAQSSNSYGDVFLSQDWISNNNTKKISNNRIFTSVIIHELGHALGKLSDEYLNESGDISHLPANSKPFLGGNCVLQDAVPTDWQTNQGVIHWSYSGSGEVPLESGVYQGCFAGNEYRRGTRTSLMKINDTVSPIDHYRTNLFLPFGVVNQKILEGALAKFEGDASSSCGAMNQKACGYSSDITLDGEKCYGYLRDFQHLFLSREQRGNFCRPCGRNNQNRCPPEEEKVMAAVNKITNGCEKDLVDIKGTCTVVPKSTQAGCYETNPGIPANILFTKPNIPRCAKDLDSQKWDVTAWKGYVKTSTDALENDPEKCYDEYRSVYQGVVSSVPNYMLYTKTIDETCN